MVEVVNFIGIVAILFLLISIAFSSVDTLPVAYFLVLGLSWWFIYWCFMTYDFAINISWVGG